MDDIPRTARDALIAELLGDVGKIDELIKQLPNEINKSTKEVTDFLEKEKKSEKIF
ncbi:hypothetical protein [Dickeya sp. NCPPB 3274]|uniref:hypothetical protein n=1 Tax=Dickeya sp. NCPPB 3274 TaxID=568766 RepID=UPI00187C8935|nr:hypothetical protein [Dickeya sp. NCPPB 3274]